MTIWNGQINTDLLNELNKGTMGEYLDIRFIAVGDDFLEATMPVTNSTKQPFGLLHGGASVALAETVGSVASWAVVNRELFIGVGIEINANHVKQVTEGVVKARCTPIKIGGKVHIWEVRIYDETGDLACISRFTCMVVPRPKR